ncbi:uncharacterized protein LOC126840314 [Adelges cooleyi]|uniref:uncharacterized protein LOC126840314 n=1 Tax=Adelges cooleyi TaxID=133065 RepID=UPI00217FAC14|nr:uncharacterized protein LOC126840314 [Adelges cooleyi]
MDLRRLNSCIMAICVCAAFIITSSNANGIQKLLSKGPTSKGLVPSTQSDQEDKSDYAAILEQAKVKEFFEKLSSIEKSFKNTDVDDNNSDLSSVVESFVRPIHNIICPRRGGGVQMPANCFCPKPCTDKLCFPAPVPQLGQCFTSPVSQQQVLQRFNCLKPFPVANQQPIKPPFPTLPKICLSPYEQQYLQPLLSANQQQLDNPLKFPTTAQQQPPASLQGGINPFGVLPQPTIFPCPQYGYPFYQPAAFASNLFWQLLSSNNPTIAKMINSLLTINQLGFGYDPVDLIRQPPRGYNIYDLPRQTCCDSVEPPVQY